MRPILEGALADASALLDAFRNDAGAVDALEQAARIVASVFRTGGKILACGNGGSLADAMHFCEEWTGRFRKDRKPYPAIPLSDPTHLTCVANDFGFEHVFSRQVEAYGRPGDVLLVLSTSGESENLIHAAQAAKESGMTVVGFLGRGGGRLSSLCDVRLLAPGETSDRIQEIHMLCLHALIEAVEAELGHGESA